MMARQLNRVLRKNRTKLVFHAEHVSELNAAKGLIEILNLRPENFEISCGREADAALVKKIIPDGQLNGRTVSGARQFDIRFDFNIGQQKLSRKGLILNHEPYKYFPKNRVVAIEKDRLQKSMGLRESRKLIVFSPTHPNEINVVLDAYQKIDPPTRPLLIVALRIPNNRLVHRLVKMRFKATNRSVAHLSWARLGQFEIVMLNTMGELSDFFKAADLAIIGHDRNLFEPAIQGVPIIYFKGPLKIGKETERIMTLFKLAWRKNKIAKYLLDRAGGAVPVHPAKLKDQIMEILGHPQKMIRGTKTAVSQLRKEVAPLCRLRVCKLLISKLHP